MNKIIPRLRSETFNEAFEAFENAFLKALTRPHPLVFETHETVMGALRDMEDDDAAAKLRNAELSLLRHASGERPLRAPDVERLISVLELDDIEALQSAAMRYRSGMAHQAHRAA